MRFKWVVGFLLGLQAVTAMAAVPANVKGPLREKLALMDKVCSAGQWADCHLVRYEMRSTMVTIPDEVEGVAYVFKNNMPASLAYYALSQHFQDLAAKRGTYDQFVGKFKPLHTTDDLFSESSYFDPNGDDAYKHFAKLGMQANLTARGIQYNVEKQAFLDGRLETLRMVALTYAMRHEPATAYRALTLMSQRVAPDSPAARQYNAVRAAVLAYLQP